MLSFNDDGNEKSRGQIGFLKAHSIERAILFKFVIEAWAKPCIAESENCCLAGFAFCGAFHPHRRVIHFPGDRPRINRARKSQAQRSRLPNPTRIKGALEG